MQKKDFDIIEVEDYAVVVDKSIKSENFAYSVDTRRILPFDSKSKLLQRESTYWAVIATIAPKRIEGLPMVQLPDDSRALAKKKYPNHYTEYDEGRAYRGFIAGYETAQSKGTFSEEDIRKAIEMARLMVEGKDEFEIEGIMGLTEVCTHNMDVKHSADEIIKSLKKKPFPVKVTIKLTCGDYGDKDGLRWFPEVTPDEHGGIIHPVNVIYDNNDNT